MTEPMTEERFKLPTKQLAVAVVRFVGELPRSPIADLLGRQPLRSATSVGTNYRAACRAKSVADMLARLAIVEEEADETLYRLGQLVESGSLDAEIAAPLHRETNEIVAMTVASIRTLRRRSIQNESPT